MTHEFSHLRIGSVACSIVAEPAGRPATIEADAVVAFLTEGGIGSDAIAEIDAATGGLLSRLVSAGEITGKRFECVPILAAPGLKAGQLVVVGLGKREDVDAGVLYYAAATASRHLAGRPRVKVAFIADGSGRRDRPSRRWPARRSVWWARISTGRKKNAPVSAALSGSSRRPRRSPAAS